MHQVGFYYTNETAHFQAFHKALYHYVIIIMKNKFNKLPIHTNSVYSANNTAHICLATSVQFMRYAWRFPKIWNFTIIMFTQKFCDYISKALRPYVLQELYLLMDLNCLHFGQSYSNNNLHSFFLSFFLSFCSPSVTSVFLLTVGIGAYCHTQ